MVARRERAGLIAAAERKFPLQLHNTSCASQWGLIIHAVLHPTDPIRRAGHPCPASPTQGEVLVVFKMLKPSQLVPWMFNFGECGQPPCSNGTLHPSKVTLHHPGLPPGSSTRFSVKTRGPQHWPTAAGLVSVETFHMRIEEDGQGSALAGLGCRVPGGCSQGS